MVNSGHFFALSAAMFSIGALGVVLRRNLIVVFMCIELMLNAANLAFVTASNAFGLMGGQSIAFFVMTVAAGEAAVGLAIILAVFRVRQTLDSDRLELLRW